MAAIIKQSVITVSLKTIREEEQTFAGKTHTIKPSPAAVNKLPCVLLCFKKTVLTASLRVTCLLQMHIWQYCVMYYLETAVVQLPTPKHESCGRQETDEDRPNCSLSAPRENKSRCGHTAIKRKHKTPRKLSVITNQMLTTLK